MARRGAALSGLTMVMVQAVSLLSTLIIARLLSPEQVGLYAAGTVLAGFIIVFTEGGLRGALVQRQHDVEDAADTVFYATFGTGVLLSVGALASAPLVGIVMDNPDAAAIAAVTSGMFLMHALTNVPDALMIRRFSFRRRLIIDPLRAVVYGGVTVGFALAGFGVWSLVIGNYASMAVWLVGSWLFARWRPGWGYPSVRLWREMARFAYPLVGWSLAALTRESLQTVLMGRSLGEAALGQYRYGRRLGDIAPQAVIQVGSFVIFPAFSRMAGEPERFRRGFFRALRWIWFGSLPLSGLLLVLGPAAVVVLLGEEWRAAGVLLMALAGVGAASALQEVSGEAMKGAGRSDRLNYLAVVELVVGVGLLIALLPLGLLGVGLAVFGMELTIAVTALVLARNVIGFSLRQVMKTLTPAFVATVVAAATVGPLEHLVVRSDTRGTVLGLVCLSGLALLFGVVYLAVLTLVDRSLVKELLDGIRRFRARRAADPAEDDDGDLDGREEQGPGHLPVLDGAAPSDPHPTRRPDMTRTNGGPPFGSVALRDGADIDATMPIRLWGIRETSDRATGPRPPGAVYPPTVAPAPGHAFSGPGHTVNGATVVPSAGRSSEES